VSGRPLTLAVAVLAAVAVMAASWGLPHLLSDYLVRILIVICIFGVLVAALGLSNGFTGVFSLGHVGFVAVGAYASGILSLSVQAKAAYLPHLPPWLAGWSLSFLPSTILAGLVCAILALAVGAPLLRLSGHYVSVATLGFLIIVNVVLVNANDFTRGSRTFTGVPVETTLPWAAGWLVVTLVILARLAYSQKGRALRAVREDLIAAQAIGIDILPTRLLAFVVGAFFSGVGGSLYGHYLGSFSPNSFSFALTFTVISMLVIGGMRSLTGAIVGVILVTLLREILRNAERGMDIAGVSIPPLYGASQIVLGVIFILIMIFRPNGIMGDVELSVGRFSAYLQRQGKEGSTAMKKEQKMFIAGLAIAGTTLLAAAAMAPAWAQDTIKIGGPSNLTGGLSSLDAPATNGAKLKIEEINAAGGVLGKKLELVVYDTKTDPTVIASVGSQLTTQDKVPVIMGFTDSDSVLAMGPIAQQAGIPLVTAGATSPKLPSQIGDNMFLACFGDNVQAAAGAEFVLNKLNAKSTYLLWDTSNEYTTLLSDYFKQAYAHGGGKILLEDNYKAGDKSYAAQITKLKALATKPDAVYVAALPDDIGLIVKQMRQAGVTQPIVGGDGYDTPLLISVGGEAANGVYYSTHAYMAEDGTEAIKAFYEAYKKAYGLAPENAFAGLGYDAIGLVADAITRAGSAEPAKIREALAATKGFKGITGDITYRPGVRVPDKGVSIIGVKDEKLYLASEVTPGWVPEP
jgi:branched-chain amino acid transport system substrate-binding protein